MARRPLASSEPPPWPRVDNTLTSPNSLFELASTPENQPGRFRFAHPSLRQLFESHVARDYASSNVDHLVIHVPGRRNSTQLKFHEVIAAVASSLRALQLPKYGSEGARVLFHAGDFVGIEWVAGLWSSFILGCEAGILDEGIMSGSADEESKADSAREVSRELKSQFVEASKAVEMGLLSLPKELAEGEVKESASTALIRPIATVLLPPANSPSFSAYPSSYHLSKAPEDPKKPRPSITNWPDYRHEAGNPFWTDLTYPSGSTIDTNRPATISLSILPPDSPNAKPIVVPLQFTQSHWTQFAHSVIYSDCARKVRRQEFQCAPISHSYNGGLKHVYGTHGKTLAVLKKGVGKVELIKVMVEAAVQGTSLHLFAGEVSPEEIVKVVEREGIDRIVFVGEPLKLASIPPCITTIQLTLLLAPQTPLHEHIATLFSLSALASSNEKPGRPATDLRIDLSTPQCLHFGTSTSITPTEFRFRVSPAAKTKMVNGRLFVRSPCAAGSGGVDTGLVCAEDGQGGFVVGVEGGGGDSKL